MSKILIVLKGQHGYNTDYFKMVNYLANQGIMVDIMCFDYGFEKMKTQSNINVIYIERHKSKILNYFNYKWKIIKNIFQQRNSYKWILISGGVEYCGSIPLLLRKLTTQTSWIMDIRTCSVSNNERKRKLYDVSLQLSSKFFNYVTVISDLLAERLKINEYTVLPLGADCIVDIQQKKFKKNQLNFLYIGTFENRNIDRLVKAYDIFCNKTNKDIKTRFDIVGFAYSDATQEEFLDSIRCAKNKDSIVYHGRKSHDEIVEIFQEASVGFSYIPITDYYDVQPPTKTFEYIINGIICIGTNTKANKNIISLANGILVDDDVESVVRGMENILGKYSEYNSQELSRTLEEYKWDKIEENFYQFLLKIDR